MAPGPGLTIAIAEKRFPGRQAPLFADFRLDIASGSVVALHGPSGVGKSTLLRLLAGIDRAFSGTIAVGGQAAGQSAPPGFVFQDPRLLPWLTARDNVRAAGAGVTAAMADAALAQVGLVAAGDAWPRALSGGMQRRVALARALATNAGLLLLDEPFVSLDPALVDDMHQVLAGIAASHRSTVVIASHLPGDAARLADRVITLAGSPARIVGDMALAVPRAHRSPAVVQRYLDDLASPATPG